MVVFFLKGWKWGEKGGAVSRRCRETKHYNPIQGRSRAAIWQLQETISSCQTSHRQSRRKTHGESQAAFAPFRVISWAMFQLQSSPLQKWNHMQFSPSVCLTILTNDCAGATHPSQRCTSERFSNSWRLLWYGTQMRRITTTADVLHCSVRVLRELTEYKSALWVITVLISHTCPWEASQLLLQSQRFISINDCW